MRRLLRGQCGAFCATLLSGAFLALGTFGAPKPPSGSVDVDPTFQETPVWCWAASAQMVFAYYEIPDLNPFGDFQCAIAALVYPACQSNCANCLTGAPSMTYMRNVLQNYPAVAAQYSGHTVNRIITDAPTGVLTKDEVMNEIDENHPIVVGISPGGFSYNGQPEHVSLIVGYDDSDSGNFILTVNDPFPYDAVIFTQQNPYIRAGGHELSRGQYSVNYEKFVSNLRWSQSIAGIRTAGKLHASSPAAATVCATPIGMCPMRAGVPIGGACFCVTPAGPVAGVGR
jgi:Peptidase_C39 like family